MFSSRNHIPWGAAFDHSLVFPSILPSPVPATVRHWQRANHAHSSFFGGFEWQSSPDSATALGIQTIAQGALFCCWFFMPPKGSTSLETPAWSHLLPSQGPSRHVTLRSWREWAGTLAHSVPGPRFPSGQSGIWAAPTGATLAGSPWAPSQESLRSCWLPSRHEAPLSVFPSPKGFLTFIPSYSLSRVLSAICPGPSSLPLGIISSQFSWDSSSQSFTNKPTYLLTLLPSELWNLLVWSRSLPLWETVILVRIPWTPLAKHPAATGQQLPNRGGFLSQRPCLWMFPFSSPWPCVYKDLARTALQSVQLFLYNIQAQEDTNYIQIREVRSPHSMWLVSGEA